MFRVQIAFAEYSSVESRVSGSEEGFSGNNLIFGGLAQAGDQ